MRERTELIRCLDWEDTEKMRYAHFERLPVDTNLQLIQAGYQGQGYIIAFVSILLGCLILGVNQHFTGKRKSFTTVTGKSGQVSLVKLRKANWPISIVLIVFTAFFAIMPLISFALESVIRQPGNYSLSNMTLHFWIGTEDSAYETGMIAGIIIIDIGIQCIQLSNQSSVMQLNPKAANRVNTVFMTTFFIGGTFGTFSAGTGWQLAGWTGVVAVGIALALLSLCFTLFTRH